MKLARLLIILAPLCAGSTSLAVAPSWSNDQTVRHLGQNNVIVVTCSGRGPAKDLTFDSAIRQCNSIAVSSMNTDFKSKSVVVETESQAPKLYSEISSELKVTGLKPKTEREFTEPTDDGFVTYIQARYDLGLATISSASAQTRADQDADSGRTVESLTTETPSAQVKVAPMRVGSERTLTISMLPEKCADYLVRGKNPRTFPCKSNPMQVMVNVANDDEIILRPATKGFLPKTLKVHRKRGITNDFEAEVVDVIFERH